MNLLDSVDLPNMRRIQTIEGQISLKASPYRLPQAQSAVIQAPDAKAVRQLVPGYHFCMELYTVLVKKRVTVNIFKSNSDLVFCYVFKGQIHCFSEQSGKGFHLLQDEYAAVFIPEDKYRIVLQKGKHIIYTFALDPNYLQWIIGDYFTLRPLLHHSINDRTCFSLPTCRIENKVKNIFHRLCRCKQQGNKLQQAEQEYINQFIAICHQQIQSGTCLPDITSKEITYAVNRYISSNFTEAGVGSTSHLARKFNIGEKTLVREHQILFGISIHRLIRNLRMELAYKLLTEMDMPVGHASAAVGYRNIDSFSKRFRKYHGYNPSYARKHLKPATKY